MKTYTLLFTFIFITIVSCKKEDFHTSGKINNSDNTSAHFLCVSAENEINVEGQEGAAKNLWQAGQTIRIKFNGGTPSAQNHVKKIVQYWTDYANIKFQFVAPTESANLTITFNSNSNLNFVNSYGTACTSMVFNWSGSPADLETTGAGIIEQPNTGLTINEYLYLAPIVLHEFGHFLGLIHEHQRGNMTWNQSVVINDLVSIYGFSNAASAQSFANSNIFNTVSASNYSTFDRSSTMGYAYPSTWNNNGIAFSPSKILSVTDRMFIGQLYPFPNQNVKYRLMAGEELKVGEAIYSQDGRYKAYLKSDGDFVLYLLNKRVADQSNSIWKTNTSGTGCRLYMQSTGKLALYNSSNTLLWNSGTGNNPGAYLQLNNNGNLVIRSSAGQTLWSTNTAVY